MAQVATWLLVLRPEHGKWHKWPLDYLSSDLNTANGTSSHLITCPQTWTRQMAQVATWLLALRHEHDKSNKFRLDYLPSDLNTATFFNKYILKKNRTCGNFINRLLCLYMAIHTKIINILLRISILRSGVIVYFLLFVVTFSILKTKSFLYCIFIIGK